MVNDNGYQRKLTALERLVCVASLSCLTSGKSHSEPQNFGEFRHFKKCSRT